MTEEVVGSGRWEYEKDTHNILDLPFGVLAAITGVIVYFYRWGRVQYTRRVFC